jgi:hypothetical protein
MNFIFEPYSIPLNKDTCVALCFFRPVEYKNPLINLKIVLEDLSLANIPYFTIELLYPNQINTISNPTLTVFSNSVLFSKENLWNILETKIPEKYTKIVFIDADIRFSNPNWLDRISESLDKHSVIQPMDFSYRDIPNNTNSYSISVDNFRPSTAKGICNKELMDISKHYPGFAIGIRRDFFKKIGGFFEYGLNGFGDSLFWGSFYDFDSKFTELTTTLFPEYIEYKNNIKNLIQDNTVGYLKKSEIFHLYHGALQNRRYDRRDHYIPTKFSVQKNEYGVLELESYDPERNLKQYWVDRKEDE